LANEQTLSTINMPHQSYLLRTGPTVALHPTNTMSESTQQILLLQQKAFKLAGQVKKMKQPTTNRHPICTVTCKQAHAFQP